MIQFTSLRELIEELLRLSPGRLPVSFSEMIRGDRPAIKISPLCGDDSVHILKRTNRRAFETKPGPIASELCGNDERRSPGYKYLAALRR
jgi:hypothetical protein